MKKLLKDRKLFVGITAILVSVGMGGAIRLLTDLPNEALHDTNPRLESAVDGGRKPLSVSLAAASENFQSSQSRLLQSTSIQSRTPKISTGRADPFASITQPPIGARPSAQPTPTENPLGLSVQAVSNQSGARLPLVPVAATQSLPPLPSLPTVSLGPSILNSPSSSGPAVVLPPVPALNTVDAIQISGVLHIGDLISVIVREPNQSTSRYVGVGAYLANGRVRVKRIDMNSGDEPIVVMEQDGQEYFKRIGDTTLTSL